MDLNEKCAVFGIYGKNLDVSRLAFFGLFALQHRGQESSGIAISNGHDLSCYKNMGLVTHVYNEEIIAGLKGFIAIGQNRYSTSAGTGLAHAQPVMVEDKLALAHNGNLPSVKKLWEFLKSKDVAVEGCSDSELMAKAIAYYLGQGSTLKQAVIDSFPLFTGAFSFTAMTRDTLVAVRDTFGIRPLVMGKMEGGSTVFASESCAFHAIGAKLEREVRPGEMIVVEEGKTESVQIMPGNSKLDIFEFVYFARPDSHLEGKLVYQVRHNCGMALAQECPLSADLIVPVPETAIPVATGYSKTTGIPMEMALVKNRYIHRTFIEPDQHSRDLGVKMKLTALPEILAGKRVVVMDDSIVRGTTSKQLVKMMFEAGCTEVHLLISSPPVKYPDFYGIDTPQQKDLIASHKSVEEIRQYLGATSLYFLSLKGLISSTGLDSSLFCLSCFTGKYPIELGERAQEIKEPNYAKILKPEGALL